MSHDESDPAEDVPASVASDVQAGVAPAESRGSRLGGRWVALGVMAVLALALFGGWALSTGGSDRPNGSEPLTTVGVAAGTAGETGGSGAETKGAGVEAERILRIKDLSELPAGPVEHLEVAYFHRTQRCHSCIEAERLVRQTLDAHFADSVGSGDVSLLVADVEAPENTQLVGTYDAWTSSLYLGVTKDGVLHVFSVADMWFDIGDEARFTESLRAKIDEILGST